MPQALGELLITAANWVVAEAGGAIAPNAFITPFAVSGTIGGIPAAELVGTIGLNVLAIGAGAALAPGAPTPQSQKANVRSPVAPRRHGYGAARVAGIVPARP